MSVCSGIEAATVAWHGLGWEAAAFAEIDTFPSAVLAYRYPKTPNLGDMTKFKEWPNDTVDVLVGGTPCQSFSVAGLRAGMADPRGNLALTYLAIADRYRPRWVVWENVPGVLSSNGGLDFAAFLGGLGKLGYGFAYRVLDAQYFGLAQRRARVFVVGCLGDWRGAAAVLFDSTSLRGDPPPRREKTKDVAPTISARTSGGGGLGTDFDLDGGLIARCDTTREGQRMDPTLETYVCHSLRGEGYDASEDGSGRGTPIVAVDNYPEPRYVDRHGQTSRSYAIEALRALRDAVDPKTLSQWGLGVLAAFWPTEVLQSKMYGPSLRCPPQPQRGLVNIALSCQKIGATWSVRDLWEAGCDGRPPQGWRPHKQLAAELGAYLSKLPFAPSPAERFMQDLWQATKGARIVRKALSEVQKIRRSITGEDKPTQTYPAVRRLVPEEAEALQGFSRGYTLVPYRGHPAKDGPRYKALGNSMAVPVMAWIGKRIALTDKWLKQPAR